MYSTLTYLAAEYLLPTLTEVFLKFCFELCLWEPFVFVTCFTSAIFSLVPKALQLPQVKDKELRSVVNKGPLFSFFLQVFWNQLYSLEPGALSRRGA